MKKRIAMKWIKALRSGDYSQGANQLVTVDREGNEHFCCLGVLCNLATEDGYGQWNDTAFTSESGDQECMVLPWGVDKWAGFKVQGRNGTISAELCLTALNDEGKSFTELADVIEKNWRNM